MQTLKIMKDNLWHPFRGAFVTLAAMGMLFAATNAAAACGDTSRSKPGFFPNLSLLVQPIGGNAQSNALAQASGSTTDNSSIVGLWHVLYTSGGQPLYDIVRSVAQ